MNWVCWVLIQGCHSAGITLAVSRHQTMCLQAKPTHTHTHLHLRCHREASLWFSNFSTRVFRLEFGPLQRRRALSAWWWKGWMTSTNGFSNIVTCDSVDKEIGFWPLPASVHYPTQSGSEKQRDHSGGCSRLLWWWGFHIKRHQVRSRSTPDTAPSCQFAKQQCFQTLPWIGLNSVQNPGWLLISSWITLPWGYSCNNK